MYARSVTFKMGPGTKETADAMREKISQALRTFPGLHKVYFMADYATGTYSSLAIWESKEAGETAFQVVNPKLQEALKGLVEEPPNSEFFEVVEVGLPEPA